MRLLRAAILSLSILALNPTRPLRAQDLTPAPASAKSWSFELFAGTSWSAPTPLTIWQVGQPDIHTMAHYKTKPWTGSPYYSFRIARWKGARAWAVDFTHQKLYLDDLPTDVQHFEVTHGYNMLHLSRIWDVDHWLLSLGGGVIFTHPENTVRNKDFYPESGGSLGGGYYLDGVSVMGAVGRHVKIAGPLFATGLGKMSLSTATIRVMDGGAEVPNVAFHINVGLGAKL
jgi:hypothetical protein